MPRFTKLDEKAKINLVSFDKIEYMINILSNHRSRLMLS